MGTRIDALTIHVTFVTFPGQPVEEWTFTSEPYSGPGAEIDESALQTEIVSLLSDGINTLSFSRRLSWSGWGAEGPTVLDVIIQISTVVMTKAVWSAFVALYKKHMNREATTNSRAATPPSRGASTRNIKKTAARSTKTASERKSTKKRTTTKKKTKGKTKPIPKRQRK